MTKQQIEQAAERYSEKYLDDPHGIAEESFIAGVMWVLENTPNGILAMAMKAQDLKDIMSKYNHLLK